MYVEGGGAFDNERGAAAMPHSVLFSRAYLDQRVPRTGGAEAPQLRFLHPLRFSSIPSAPASAPRLTHAPHRRYYARYAETDVRRAVAAPGLRQALGRADRV